MSRRSGGPPTVLLVHSSSGRYGADRQLALIARGLDPARYRPLVVLPEDGDLVKDLRAAGVPTRVRPLAVVRRELLSTRGMAGMAAALLSDRRELGDMIARAPIALVHSNTSVLLGGAAAARRRGVPHLWHVREIYTEFQLGWSMYQRLLGATGALACVSQATRAQFDGRLGTRARVVYDGLALPSLDALDGRATENHAMERRARARSALGLAAEGLVYVVLGRLSSWKGQEVLLRALAEPVLASRAAGRPRVVVAGEAWRQAPGPRQGLSDLARELGVAEQVRFAGFVDDPGELYAAADVVMVPSTQPDPLPNAALEAAAAGCCVVASNVGGLPEILTDRRTGRLVAPGDPRALAVVLAELAEDPLQRRRLGQAAREDIRRRFGFERLLEQVQGLYDELLGGAIPTAAAGATATGSGALSARCTEATTATAPITKQPAKPSSAER